MVVFVLLGIVGLKRFGWQQHERYAAEELLLIGQATPKSNPQRGKKEFCYLLKVSEDLLKVSDHLLKNKIP